jgi:hypothetical protein
MKILKVFSNSQSNSHSCLKFNLFKNKLKLSLFCQFSFIEIILPLLGEFNSEGVDQKENIFFTLDFNIMFKISQEFVDSNLKVRFDSEKNLIQVFSNQTKLELEANKERAIEYHTKIQGIKYIKKVDLNIIQESIKYISHFVCKNNLQKFLSLAEFRDSYLCGGSYSNIGVYQSDKFENLHFKVSYENLSLLSRLPNYFNLENTHLFETEDYFIFRDENLYLGIEKVNFSFPSIEKFLNFKSNETIILSRENLLSSIRKLAIVLEDGVKINFKISRGNNLKLWVKDLSGKVSTDNMEIQRKDEKFEDIEFSIELEPFRKVLNHFKNPNVYLELIDTKALILIDEIGGEIITSYFNLI